MDDALNVALVTADDRLFPMTAEAENAIVLPVVLARLAPVIEVVSEDPGVNLFESLYRGARMPAAVKPEAPPASA